MKTPVSIISRNFHIRHWSHMALRADYDGDTLLSADVGGTGSRYGLRGLQRIGKNLRMPKDTLLGTKIHISTKGSF